MRVFITGGTGFIGRHLVRELVDAGHEAMILSRRPARVAETFGRGVIGLAWTDSHAQNWLDAVNGDTAIINLAGENIFGRWTAGKMQRIKDSRVRAGHSVMQAIEQAPVKPKTLIQASAVGFYGPRDQERMDEDQGPGQGFLSEVCREWEGSTRAAEDMGIRRVVVRTGVVLGDGGGALSQMARPFRFFLGGPMGRGGQGVSWIHMADQVGAIRFLLENANCEGVFNLAAPEPVSNARFSRTLAKVLRRPCWIRTPAFALKAMFGRMAEELLLSGQYVLPRRLEALGYRFQHPDLEEALASLLRPANPA